MSDIDQIKTLAKHTRNLCERYLIAYPLNLEGACAIASFHLYKSALKNNIKLKLCYGECKDKRGLYHHHYWVEFKDKIIDITSTQFGYRNKVRIKNKSKDYRYIDKSSKLNKCERMVEYWWNEYIPLELRI